MFKNLWNSFLVWVAGWLCWLGELVKSLDLSRED